MVTLLIKVVTSLLFFIMPFLQKSVSAVMSLSGTNDTVIKPFDFRVNILQFLYY